jgi:hypothetical protein
VLCRECFEDHSLRQAVMEVTSAWELGLLLVYPDRGGGAGASYI